MMVKTEYWYFTVQQTSVGLIPAYHFGERGIQKSYRHVVRINEVSQTEVNSSPQLPLPQ